MLHPLFPSLRDHWRREHRMTVTAGGSEWIQGYSVTRHNRQKPTEIVETECTSLMQIQSKQIPAYRQEMDMKPFT